MNWELRKLDYVLQRLTQSLDSALSFPLYCFNLKAIRNSFAEHKGEPEYLWALDALQSAVKPFEAYAKLAKRNRFWFRLHHDLKRWRQGTGHAVLNDHDHMIIRERIRAINALEKTLISEQHTFPEIHFGTCGLLFNDRSQSSNLRLIPEIELPGIAPALRRIFDTDLGVCWSLESYSEGGINPAHQENCNPYQNSPEHPLRDIPFGWLMWIVHDDAGIVHTDLAFLTHAELNRQFQLDYLLEIPQEELTEHQRKISNMAAQRAIIIDCARTAEICLTEHSSKLSQLVTAVRWLLKISSGDQNLSRSAKQQLRKKLRHLLKYERMTKTTLLALTDWKNVWLPIISPKIGSEIDLSIKSRGSTASRQLKELSDKLRNQILPSINERVDGPITVTVYAGFDLTEFPELDGYSQFDFLWNTSCDLEDQIDQNSLPWLSWISTEIHWENKTYHPLLSCSKTE